jgi:uncharacterized protein
MSKNLLIWTIRGYQRMISKYTPPTCRYQPTCSTYAIEALSIHGWFKGGVLSIWRILRCNPFGSYGLDPVPNKD